VQQFAGIGHELGAMATMWPQCAAIGNGINVRITNSWNVGEWRRCTHTVPKRLTVASPDHRVATTEFVHFWNPMLHVTRRDPVSMRANRKQTMHRLDGFAAWRLDL
jgi:hypothetical protein